LTKNNGTVNESLATETIRANRVRRGVRFHLKNGHSATQTNVRFGSKADICSASTHFALRPIATAKSGFPQKVMSASPPKADMCGATRDVRFGPKADITALVKKWMWRRAVYSARWQVVSHPQLPQSQDGQGSDVSCTERTCSVRTRLVRCGSGGAIMLPQFVPN